MKKFDVDKKKPQEKKVVISEEKEKSAQKEIDKKQPQKKEEEKKNTVEKSNKKEEEKKITVKKEDVKIKTKTPEENDKKISKKDEDKKALEDKRINKENEVMSSSKFLNPNNNTKKEGNISERESKQELVKVLNQNDGEKRDNSKKKREKIELPASEIIEQRQEIIQVKQHNSTFARSLMQEKIEDIKGQVSEEILKGVINGMDSKEKTAYQDIIQGQLKFSSEPKTIEQIISHKSQKKTEIEEIIRIQRIKDLQENQDHIKNKLLQVNENMKVLESEGYFNLSKIDLNSSLNVIDDNVRRSQIREFKEAKELLTQRMHEINNQIQKLMTDEEQNELAKKINIKQFLENFERDKEIAVIRANKYEIESKHREEKMKADLERVADKRLKEHEEAEKEKEKARRQKLEEIHLKEVELLKKIATKNEAALNLSRLKIYNNNNEKENEYLFQIKEKEFNIMRENEVKEELMKYKSKMRQRQITRDEIDEFNQQRAEILQNREAAKEEEKQRLQELWKATSENLPKYESQIKLILQEEDNKEREAKEYQSLKSKIKQKEIKDYSETVVKLHLPKINPQMQKEIEDRLLRLKSRPKIPRHHRKHQRILLKKSDPNKMRKKFKWKLKLSTNKTTTTTTGPHRSQSRYISSYSPERRSRSRSEGKRKPLAKLPDYLTEIRLRKEKLHRTANSSEPAVEKESKFVLKKWERMMGNNQNSLLENVEQIKIRAQMLEEKAKMKERFLKLNGGSERNPELCEDVSSMLIDAIKAKLAILGSVSQKTK